MIKLSLSLAGFAFGATSFAAFLGPSPYLQTSDSPWVGGSFTYFHLDDFESNAIAVPGVAKDAGVVISSTVFGLNCDSVDGDDGVINGVGNPGHSFFSGSGSSGVTWTFNETTLGNLPTHAGIVWTDGSGTITFEAWDQNGVSLGTVIGSHADASTSSTTGEDRFYGIEHSGGVSKIKLSNSNGGIEMDHLQYGYNPVPEPATMLALGVGAILTVRRKRTLK